MSVSPSAITPNQHRHRRHERVIVETERYRFVGTLTLPAEGYRTRVSDLFNTTDREFIVLSDVEITAHGIADEIGRRPFAAISRSRIVFVTDLAD